jgi:hypothetical protein
VSVADCGEPEASCWEWHADGTTGEDDRASHLAAVPPARAMGEPVQDDTSLVGKPPKAARQRWLRERSRLTTTQLRRLPGSAWCTEAVAFGRL